jgi:Ribbon-helix-helix protein, copG family
MSSPSRPLTGENMKQVVIRLPRDLYDALLADAEANDRSIAQTVRRAVKQHLGLP